MGVLCPIKHTLYGYKCINQFAKACPFNIEFVDVYFAFDMSIDINHLNLWNTCYCTESTNINVLVLLILILILIWFSYLFAKTYRYCGCVCVSLMYNVFVHWNKRAKKKLIVSIEKSIILGQFYHHWHQFGSNWFFFLVLHYVILWTIHMWHWSGPQTKNSNK